MSDVKNGPSPQPSRRRSRWQSFRDAFAGLAAVFRTQRNAKIQSAAAVLALVAAAGFRVSFVEWLALVLCIGGVLTAEAINTAIEAAVDLASPEWHATAKLAKDAAAGAVLLAALTSVVVGVMVFGPRLLALFA